MWATIEVTNAGQWNPTIKNRSIGYSHIVLGMVYGLVNVRTDGDKILCATRNEAEHTWEVNSIISRF